MSNSFKNRKEEAWEDLAKIASIIEEQKDSIIYQGFFYKQYERIKEILQEGEWA